MTFHCEVETLDHPYCADAPQAAVHGAGRSAGVPGQGVQDEQALVHGERRAPLEAPQRGPEQPPPDLPLLPAAQLLLLPVASQLRSLLQPPPLAQIAASFREARPRRRGAPRSRKDQIN